METSGYNVRTQPVDVSSRESVTALAAAAAELSAVTGVVHTAGLSPAQAPVDAILKVTFSSMAGHMMPALTPEQDAALARTPADDLMQLPLLQGLLNTGAAYAMSKRANTLRVQAAAVEWGDRGARINSTPTPAAASSCVPEITDTEEVTGSNPVSPTRKALFSHMSATVHARLALGSVDLSARAREPTTPPVAIRLSVPAESSGPQVDPIEP
jgi:NAD(P)-dependent dehydrogenase (short-subunit alcohol dehydrogenase family)